VQNWANHLPSNVTKELAGHASISTTMEYYAQVDDDHRVKVAAVINSLVSDCVKEDTAETTDAQSQFRTISGRRRILEMGTSTYNNIIYITTPGRIRTCDLRFRKPTLYPTELRAPQYLTCQSLTIY
jgi:hypothetical protein